MSDVLRKKEKIIINVSGSKLIDIELDSYHCKYPLYVNVNKLGQIDKGQQHSKCLSRASEQLIIKT